jgi:hypothetical protein
MTGKEVAYFRALKSGRRDSFDAREYSITHCFSRTRYGRLAGPGVSFLLKHRWKGTHLIIVGITHLSHGPSAGVRKRVLPGRSIQPDNHTSPSTFAYEVKISANTTSAKYIGPSIDVNRHRRMALGVIQCIERE